MQPICSRARTHAHQGVCKGATSGLREHLAGALTQTGLQSRTRGWGPFGGIFEVRAQVPCEARALAGPFCGCGKQISEQEELAQGRAETSSQAHLTSKPMLPTTRYSVSRQGSLLFFPSFCFLQSHPTKGIWKSALHSSV